MPNIRERIATDLQSGVLLPDEAATGSSATDAQVHKVPSQDQPAFTSKKCIKDIWETTELSNVAESSWERLPKFLQLVLPKVYTYMIKHIESQHSRDFIGAQTEPFNAQIRTSVTCKDEAQNWLKSMMDYSQCTYRVTRTYKPTMKHLLFRVGRHCQHQQKALSPNTWL